MQEVKEQVNVEARAGAPAERAAYLHMLWGAFAFSVMAALSHAAGERCDWHYVAAARTLIAFAVSLGVALASGVRLVLWRKTLWVRSLAGSTGLLCWFYTTTHLPVSEALTLSNTAPLWVALLGWLVFKQRPTAGVWVAVLVGVAGVALIQQPHFQSGNLAGLIGVFNAFCIAVAMLGLNRLGEVDPRAVVAHFSGVSTVVTLAFLLLDGAHGDLQPPADAPTFTLLALVGVVGAAGQFGMTIAFARGHATRVSVVALSQILFGLLFDVLIWHRGLNLLSLTGMALVAAPTAWLLLHNPLRRKLDDSSMPAAQ